MLIKHANVLLPEGRFQRCDLRFSDVIEELGNFDGEAGLDAEGGYLLPGLIDGHTHGLLGCDFSDGPDADLAAMARGYAQQGVTSVLATTMALKEEALVRAAAHAAAFTQGQGMADIAGLHLEGPFLSYEKRGAQDASALCAPSSALFTRACAAAKGRVKALTLAPELPGAMELIREASRSCRVSIGHTACDYAVAMAAFDAGATQLTHLYNGMNDFLHRAPGPIGAGADAGVYAELICDGLHVHPSAVRAAFRLFERHVVLVSDSLRCAGMPDGLYTLAGQSVTMQNGRCTLTGTDTLAGSAITLYQGMLNAVRFGIPFEQAAAAATHNPARAFGLQDTRGFLRAGLRADLVLLTEDLSLSKVFIGGCCLSN